MEVLRAASGDQKQAAGRGLGLGDRGNGFYEENEGLFVSIDLKAANFAALSTLGYVGGLESWSALVDEVMGPAERVAPLFHCKWFRQFALNGFLETEVEREQRKMVRQICHALREGEVLNYDNMVRRNRDEVIISIDSDPTLKTKRELAVAWRTRVETILAKRWATRVEVFKLKKQVNDLATFAEKRNLENDTIQIKAFTLIRT